MNMSTVNLKLLFFIFAFVTMCLQTHNRINAINQDLFKKIIGNCEEEVLKYAYEGYMCDGIKNIAVTFQSHQKLDIAEARNKIVNQIEKIRDIDVNENLKLFPQ